MKLNERAELDEKKCQQGAGQLMYSLAMLGVLDEPYRSYAVGMEVPDSDKNKWNSVIIEMAGDILMFNDEITEYGTIL